jgi:hypothetical protein
LPFFLSASLFLLAFSFFHPPVLIGDGRAYWATLESLANYGNPAIPEILGPLAIEATSGNFYAIHFFAYPLISVAAYWLLELFGLSTLKAFQLTNSVLVMLVVYAVLFRSELPKLARWIVIGGFLTSSLYYLGWSHPEVFSAAFILLATMGLLAGKHTLAALFSAIASLQNPSAIFLVVPIVLDLLIKVDRPPMREGGWQGIMVDFAKVFVASSPFAIPYLWSIFQFGVWNPIQSRGFVDYSDISSDRLFSLIFDLNQGLVVGMFMLLVTVPLAVAARFVDFRKRSGPLLARHDLLVVEFLLMALPTLTQQNWNAGDNSEPNRQPSLGTRGCDDQDQL